MDPHVGSGRIITAPIITEEGMPIKDPLVLLEAASDEDSTSQGGSTSGRDGKGVVDGTVDPVTDKQTIEWKLTLHQIGKGVSIDYTCSYFLLPAIVLLSTVLWVIIGLDVLRTDRSMVFYEKKENLSKLFDILAVYAWIDKEVGYCQGTCRLLFAYKVYFISCKVSYLSSFYILIGMSDLCSPMIVLLNDEADAFWCFERLMRRLVSTASPSVCNLTCFLLISLTDMYL